MRLDLRDVTLIRDTECNNKGVKKCFRWVNSWLERDAAGGKVSKHLLG